MAGCCVLEKTNTGTRVAKELCPSVGEDLVCRVVGTGLAVSLVKLTMVVLVLLLVVTMGLYFWAR